MTTIHLVTGGKGNVGKTAFSSVLRCLAMQAGAEPQLIDADAKKQTLSGIYGESVSPILLSDDPSEESQPDLVWYLAETTKRDVIVDLAAQSDEYITNWIESRGVIAMAKSADIQIIKWWVSDLDPSSFTELLNLCNDYQNDIQHVLVKSQYRAKAKMWDTAISKSESLKAAINSGNLPTIEFPRLFTGLMDKMRDEQKQFYECILDDDHQLLDMLNRSTVMRWIAKCKEAIDPVFQFAKAEQLIADPVDDFSTVETVDSVKSATSEVPVETAKPLSVAKAKKRRKASVSRSTASVKKK